MIRKTWIQTEVIKKRMIKLNEQTSLCGYVNIVNCVSLCSGPATW